MYSMGLRDIKQFLPKEATSLTASNIHSRSFIILSSQRPPTTTALKTKYNKESQLLKEDS